MPEDDAARIAALYERLVERMERYKDLIEELREQRLTPEGFRRLALREGIVTQDDSAWIFDLANQRWLHYDGVELTPVGIGATSTATDQSGGG